MAKKDFAAMERGRGSTGDSRARDALKTRMSTPPSRLKVDELQPNPLNPRYADDDPEVKELAETLARVGQLQPALVVALEEYLRVFPDQRPNMGRESWVVIVGNRRLAASHVAGRPTLDVRVVEDLSTAEDFEDRVLIENIQRKDLPPLLEAEHLRRRLARSGESFRTVAEAIGKSHAYVQQRVELLKLIPEFQALLRSGALSIKMGRQIGGLPEDEQHRIAEAGPPYAPTPAARSAAPAVNPVPTSSGEAGGDGASALDPDDGVNPVASDVSGDGGGGSPAPEPDDAVNPVATSTPPRDHDALETTRTSVMSSIETALTLLDRALPDGGDGSLGRALAEGHRLLSAAWKTIDEANSADQG